MKIIRFFICINCSYESHSHFQMIYGYDRENFNFYSIKIERHNSNRLTLRDFIKVTIICDYVCNGYE